MPSVSGQAIIVVISYHPAPATCRAGLNSSVRQQLSKIKPFILDNSLRESTVGSIYEHTIEQKHEINDWASRCNIKHQIVASLVNVERVDDFYVQVRPLSRLFAFQLSRHACMQAMPHLTALTCGLVLDRH